MKQKKNSLLNSFMFMILVLAILLILFVVALNNSQKENKLLSEILKADINLAAVSIDSQMADVYYDEASYDYEDGNYKSVESNCRIAREYFFQESQGYKTIKAEMKALEIKDNLITLYINSLDELIEISNNMFEACEHFESAARYYETYYNTDVPYDDMSYEMGTSEIEMMNEKIADHDYAVEKYNNLIEDFKVELKKRIE